MAANTIFLVFGLTCTLNSQPTNVLHSHLMQVC